MIFTSATRGGCVTAHGKMFLCFRGEDTDSDKICYEAPDLTFDFTKTGAITKHWHIDVHLGGSDDKLLVVGSSSGSSEDNKPGHNHAELLSKNASSWTSLQDYPYHDMLWRMAYVYMNTDFYVVGGTYS